MVLDGEMLSVMAFHLPDSDVRSLQGSGWGRKDSWFAAFESTMLSSIAIMVLDGVICLAISFQESTSDIASTYNLGCGAGWTFSTPAGILSEKGWESEREAVGEESVGRRTTVGAVLARVHTRGAIIYGIYGKNSAGRQICHYFDLT